MPHLRELVELYEDEPFAVIGINVRDSRKAYLEGIEKYEVSWISAWQDGGDTLNRLYKVRGYPTYYLIDQEGKIVSTGHSSRAFDEPIARLLRSDD